MKPDEMLIHVPRLTNRLGYTIRVVFGRFMHLQYQITTSEEYFRQYEGAKLCYGLKAIGDGPFIKSTRLLFETSIREQEFISDRYCGLPILYPVYGEGLLLPFDILAATFYLLSRYEEYLPHIKDKHGRYQASESIAQREGFLQRPIVDIYTRMLADRLKEVYPEMELSLGGYEFNITIDIDTAYRYKGKGVLQTITSIGRDLHGHRIEAIRERRHVIAGKKEDPYDTFDHLLRLKREHPEKKMIFFAQVADYNRYDKPTPYYYRKYRELLQHLNDYAKVGLHASYESIEHTETLTRDLQRLTEILHRPIIRNRFHYLRFQLPHSYAQLVSAGITHDYSMGYAEEVGYRAGTGQAYPFFDIEHDKETPLIVHPFVVMDTTLKRKKNLTAQQAYETYCQLIDEAKKQQTVFSGIWHNQNLSIYDGWGDWRETMDRVIAY